MRFLTAILVLAAAIPSYAQTSVESAVNYLSVNSQGKRGLVQQYDGQQTGGVQVDLAINALGDNTYLGLVVNGLNGPDASGYFDLDLGADVALKGKFDNLTHRIPFLKTGVITNGVLAAKAYTTTLYLSSAPTTGRNVIVDVENRDLRFTRNETGANAAFSFPNSPGTRLNAGFWQEREYGEAALRYNSSQVNVGYVDRTTKDVTLGVNTVIGEGAVSVDYTERNFQDKAKQLVDESIYARGPISKMGVTDLRYRTGAGAVIPVTAALSARTRTSAVTKFMANAYSATVAAAYKPLKKLYLTGKAYGRTVTTLENHSFKSVKGGNYVWGGANGPNQAIDQYNLSADLKARYAYSDKMSFSAGYKYENNYRANVSTYSFKSHINYTDQYLVLYPSHTLLNLPAVQDTRHTASLGVDASLPFDMVLNAGYSRMMANRAVYNGSSDDKDKISASLVVPLPFKLTLVTSAGYMAEKNKREDYIKMSRRQNSYQTAIEWAGNSRFYAGADYTYEQNSDHSDMYNGYQSTGQIHIIGALYRYENNTMGYHAGWKMNREFSLLGNGSYTISRCYQPDSLNQGLAAAVTTRVIFAPKDIRIARGSIAFNYNPARYKDVTARLGYRRDQWIDKVFTTQSGAVNTIDASVSARF